MLKSDKPDNKDKDKKRETQKRKKSTAIDLLDDEACMVTGPETLMDSQDEEESDQDEVYQITDKHVKSLVDWYCDSATTRHMGANKQYFINLRAPSRPMYVKVGNGAKIPVLGVGTVQLPLVLQNGNEINIQKANLKDVLYVPDLMANLLSIRIFAEHNIGTNFNPKGSKGGPLTGYFHRNGKTIMTTTLKNNQYCLDIVHSRNFREKALLSEIAEDHEACVAVNDKVESSSDHSTMETSDEEELLTDEEPSKSPKKLFQPMSTQ